MIEQLQALIQHLNGTVKIDPMVINMLTGLIVSIVLLSIRNFKYTPSSKFRWSKTMYYTASGVFLFGIVINRLANFPVSYPPTSLIYMIAYMLFFGYILYAGSKQAERSLHAKQTNNSTKNIKSLR
jgi:hypothetical protein